MKTMRMQDIILLLIIGLFAGFISGSMGVGGGIIIVPALVFLFGMSQQEAQGTSLGVLVFPVVLFAAYNYYKEGYINIKFSLFLIITFIIGGYFGSMLAVNLSSATLRKIFGGLVLLVGIKMILGK